MGLFYVVDQYRSQGISLVIATELLAGRRIAGYPFRAGQEIVRVQTQGLYSFLELLPNAFSPG